MSVFLRECTCINTIMFLSYEHKSTAHGRYPLFLISFRGPLTFYVIYHQFYHFSTLIILDTRKYKIIFSEVTYKRRLGTTTQDSTQHRI